MHSYPAQDARQVGKIWGDFDFDITVVVVGGGDRCIYYGNGNNGGMMNYVRSDSKDKHSTDLGGHCDS